MKANYTPSVNIIRDAQNDLAYVLTENAEKSAIQLLNDFAKGYHSFSIIGSYGTGKSSFLWAFQKSITGKKAIFDLKLPKGIKKVKVINLVGDYNSLLTVFNENYGIKSDFTSNQKLFDAIFQEYQNIGENGLLLINIDEFGKFLEYASLHNPEKEMYFIQQLAEFVNDPERNIMLLTTLHQGIDTYAISLNDSQKNEWRKVKGRLKEITFNEPVEQLLTLAAAHFEKSIGKKSETVYTKNLTQLQKNHRIFVANDTYFEKLENSLYPLDIFSAYTLTQSLQKYGQNERSLFSFLRDSDDFMDKIENQYFSIPEVYDYLFHNYYYFLNSKSNPDYSNWNSIKDALQKIEVIESILFDVASDLIKTIGLLSIFAGKGARIDQDFLIQYFQDRYPIEVKVGESTLKILEKSKVIKYSQFNKSYRIYEGSDLDIEAALLKAENQVPKVVDLIPKLEAYFEFPIVTAKAASYKTGTPRLFEYELSEEPIFKTPKGVIDGYINLIFNLDLNTEHIVESSNHQTEAILYAFFKNTAKVTSAIYEIEKTNQVLKNIIDDNDRVAIKELQSILKSNKVLLNHFVLDALFNENDVAWIYKGELISIKNRKELNKKLSSICDEVYYKTPVLRNELFNKHKVSPAISTARKNYFEALVNHFDEQDLGFDPDKFPPEKSIYNTLLKKNGIHVQTSVGFELRIPDQHSDLYDLWEVCQNFLIDAREDRKSITELIEVLTSAPYKIKQGVVDFWIPTFLFIRKGDYALYSEGVFKPNINEQELYLITRTPELYQVKSFELSNLRLSFFNKYRQILQQNETNSLTVNSFIESIRPILLLYKGLTPYAQKTNRISKEAIQLREVIQHTQDPEKVFFDQFPKALGFNEGDLLKSEEHFDSYIYTFQSTIEEIKNSLNELMNRIEKFIVSEIFGLQDASFEVYKALLMKRFSVIREHQLLPKQKTFLQRVNSPLNDRDSWIASISQTLLGKTLTSIEDNDEKILKDQLKNMVLELDNLSEIDKLEVDTNTEEIFKIDFTSKTTGTMPYLVRFPIHKIEQAQKSMDAVLKELGKDKQTRIAILAKLLKQELDHE